MDEAKKEALEEALAELPGGTAGLDEIDQMMSMTPSFPEQESDRPKVTIVRLDELLVTRDEGGLVDPLGPCVTPMCMMGFWCRPLTMADQRRYRISVEEDVKIGEVPEKVIHKIITTHITDPDLSGLTLEQMRNNMTYLAPYDLAAGVLLWSRDSIRLPMIRRIAKEKADADAASAEDSGKD